MTQERSLIHPICLMSEIANIDRFTAYQSNVVEIVDIKDEGFRRRWWFDVRFDFGHLGNAVIS